VSKIVVNKDPTDMYAGRFPIGVVVTDNPRDSASSPAG
jgi:hypothetical protein